MLKMENKIVKIGMCFLIFGVLAIMSGVLVSAAFGIGFPNGVSLYPGEILDTGFSIQNVIDPTEDIVIEVSVVEGSDYVTLSEGTQFSVPAGEVIPVPIRISVSDSANIGDLHNIVVSFSTVSGGIEGGGTVDIAFGITKSFDIEVVKRSETTPDALDTSGEPGEGSLGVNIWLWVIGVIVLFVILWFVFRKKTPKLDRPDLADPNNA